MDRLTDPVADVDGDHVFVTFGDHDPERDLDSKDDADGQPLALTLTRGLELTFTERVPVIESVIDAVVLVDFDDVPLTVTDAVGLKRVRVIAVDGDHVRDADVDPLMVADSVAFSSATEGVGVREGK